MQILAPCGNRAALDRAAASGATEVYLGYSAFSARASAGNFNRDELIQAVRFAHLHHIRVHVTVNTLVKDSELDDLMDVLRFLNSIPVDAVLIQDMGVVDLCRKHFPGLAIHASTQMAIHNLTGARFCRDLGLERAVLARECSISEIAKCCGEGIEIEVFGHGAQCVSVSGECLFSSMVGGRSGNRGRCAQPCRMQYRYRGVEGAWLSPRDVCTRDHLPALHNAGVCSLKIEGRLKRPEYVSVVTQSYAKANRAIEKGCFVSADENEKRNLMQIFQRGGFMHGYAMGAQDANVIAPDRVNHGGILIGHVTAVRGNMAQAKLMLPLHDGDGLQLRGKLGDREMTYSGHDELQTATIRLRPGLTAQVGDEIIRLADEQQLKQAREMEIPLIPITLSLYAHAGQMLTLIASDGQNTVTVTGDIVSEAQKRALTEQDAIRSLEKLGGTPFSPQSISVECKNAFVPVSVLNAIRREAIDCLTNARIDAFARPFVPERSPQPFNDSPNALSAPDVLIFRTAQQLKSFNPSSSMLPVWYPQDFRQEALLQGLSALPRGIWLRLPTVCEEATLNMLHHFVHAHTDYLGGVLLGSVGQLGLKWNIPYAASQDIPVTNRRTALFLLNMGCRFVTSSPQLTGDETRFLCENLPVTVPLYGRTQLMLLHHCPARTHLGLTSGHNHCHMCDEHHPDSLQGQCLTDRFGHSFPLLRTRLPEGCMIRLMNTLPTDNLSRGAGLKKTIELTCPNDGDTTTAGHWYNGIE